MKSVWGNVKNIVIVILIGWLVFEKSCDAPCPDPVPCPEFDTTAFIASLPIEYPDTSYVPTPYPVYHTEDSLVYVEIPADVDSLAVVLAYFSPSIYLDSIGTPDSLFLLVLRDSVNENRIQRREILDLILYPTFKIVTKTVIEPYVPRNKVFLGLGVGGWTDKFGVTANMMFMNKRDNAYQLSYDPLNNTIYGTAFWKIKTKRSK